jgi:hypothetical protein
VLTSSGTADAPARGVGVPAVRVHRSGDRAAVRIRRGGYPSRKPPDRVVFSWDIGPRWTIETGQAQTSEVDDSAHRRPVRSSQVPTGGGALVPAMALISTQAARLA